MGWHHRQVELKRIDEPPVVTFYSQGYERRALELRQLIQEAHHYLTSLMAGGPTVYLGILRQYDWQRLRRVPYGYPHSNPTSQAVYAPARYPPRIINPTRRLFETAPPHLQQRLLAPAQPPASQDLDSQINLFYDLVLIHELSHIFIHHTRLELGTHWLLEFTANYLTYCVLTTCRPTLAADWITWAEIQASAREVTHRSLAAFDANQGRIDFANFHWYQGQFNLKVRDVYASQGTGFVHALLATFALTPEVVMGRVSRIAPSFEQWAASLDHPPDSP
jgi:hypothetical protein